MFTCVKRVRLKAQPDQLFPDGCCIISDVCWLLDQTGTETTRCRKTHLHLQIRDWNYRIAATGAFTVQQAWTEKCRLRVSAEKKKKKKRRDYAQITIKKRMFRLRRRLLKRFFRLHWFRLSSPSCLKRMEAGLQDERDVQQAGNGSSPAVKTRGGSCCLRAREVRCAGGKLGMWLSQKKNTWKAFLRLRGDDSGKAGHTSWERRKRCRR